MLRHLLFAAVGFTLIFATPASAANIVINNLNAPGEGFNDPTPASPVGGNGGTTVGEQRLNVFEEAARIWGDVIDSDVTIVVDAVFTPQFCDATSATLGSAGPRVVFRDFTGAEFPSTWYHGALGNKLAGEDLDEANSDIRAQFNENLNGDPNCLGGRGWYYGLDGNEGGDVELLPVVLHEIAHGLGFSSFVDDETGERFQGFIDVYSRFLFDEEVGLSWSSMSDAQRAQSAIRPQAVVWTGTETTNQIPTTLSNLPALTLLEPAGIAATITQIGSASFGPSVADQTIEADVFDIDDGVAPETDGCSAALNGSTLNGAIALIDRGSCTFASKVLNAQDGGAVAVILVNNVPGEGPPQMGGTPESPVTIPVISVTFEQGTAIRDALSEGVRARIGVDPDSYAGASPQSDRAYIFTPNPLQQGSSVSHWDVSAAPNLLMEPAINGNLSSDVDLTRWAFRDQGWSFAAVSTDDSPSRVVTRLTGNAPNPFNPQTTIFFDLGRNSAVELSVYDAAGRKVATLIDGIRAAGPQQITWNGTDDGGRTVASGVYHYRLRADGFDESRRMVLLK